MVDLARLLREAVPRHPRRFSLHGFEPSPGAGASSRVSRDPSPEAVLGLLPSRCRYRRCHQCLCRPGMRTAYRARNQVTFRSALSKFRARGKPPLELVIFIAMQIEKRDQATRAPSAFFSAAFQTLIVAGVLQIGNLRPRAAFTSSSGQPRDDNAQARCLVGLGNALWPQGSTMIEWP
jgi:hypothetical protein